MEKAKVKKGIEIIWEMLKEIVVWTHKSGGLGNEDGASYRRWYVYL